MDSKGELEFDQKLSMLPVLIKKPTFIIESVTVNEPKDKSEKDIPSISIIYGCFRENKCCYVGQHNTSDINNRVRKHKNAYIEFIRKERKSKGRSKNKAKNKAKGCPALYRAFNKYGFDNFEWQLLTSTENRSEINQLENEYIIKYNTLSPNGYNLKLNKTDENPHTVYPQEILDKISANVRQANLTSYVNHRKYVKELEGLPQYVNYFKNDNERRYILRHHPKYPSKSFVSKDLSDEVLKQKMIDYLKKCEAGENTSKKRALPIGVKTSKQPGTYTAYMAYKGKNYEKYFYGEGEENNLQRAIAWRKQAEQHVNNGHPPTGPVVDIHLILLEIKELVKKLLTWYQMYEDILSLKKSMINIEKIFVEMKNSQSDKKEST